MQKRFQNVTSFDVWRNVVNEQAGIPKRMIFLICVPVFVLGHIVVVGEARTIYICRLSQ